MYPGTELVMLNALFIILIKIRKLNIYPFAFQTHLKNFMNNIFVRW